MIDIDQWLALVVTSLQNKLVAVAMVIELLPVGSCNYITIQQIGGSNNLVVTMVTVESVIGAVQITFPAILL